MKDKKKRKLAREEIIKAVISAVRKAGRPICKREFRQIPGQSILLAFTVIGSEIREGF
jgi:hypothetical protein